MWSRLRPLLCADLILNVANSSVVVETFLFLQEWRFGRSRSSKVIDFGTNRKRVCDFLLVRHSNFGLSLHRFGDIAGFFVLMTPPLFRPNFGCVSVGPDVQIAHVGVNPSRSYKLISPFSREIIFEVFQPVWKSYLNVTDRRQTDGRLIVASSGSA